MANIVNIWNITVLLTIIGCFARDGWALDDLYICAPAPRKCVCYDQVGCFSTVAPFNNSKSILPKSPSDVGVQGQLFTRRNPNNTYPVGFINTTWIKGSNFNASLPTKFVIHGFSNTNLTEWLYEMKDELLKKGDFNVFVISWGPGARFPAYDAAVANSRITARMVTLLITNLVAKGQNPDDIHLIGHSLGAHLSGVTGAELKARNITLGRISGMDPAEPDFLNYGDGVRLSKDDAQFVDVIHTDGQKFSGIKGYGIDIPSGHVDFFINGGQSQPDCSKSNPFGNLLGLLGKGTDALAAALSCSHSRSHEVFAESINSLCSFTAYPCESYEKFQAGECFSCGTTGCTRMGFPANRYTATGSFYLNTREDSPFCGHHYRVKVTLAKNTTRTTGQFMVKLNGTWGNSEWLNVTKSKSDQLLGGGILNRVVVAEQTVGYVQSISVKYATGSRGQRTLAVDTIEIEAGENGLIYLFCLKTTLTNKQVIEFQSTNSKSCPS